MNTHLSILFIQRITTNSARKTFFRRKLYRHQFTPLLWMT
jgi:hypothetical protein